MGFETNLDTLIEQEAVGLNDLYHLGAIGTIDTLLQSDSPLTRDDLIHLLCKLKESGTVSSNIAALIDETIRLNTGNLPK